MRWITRFFRLFFLRVEHFAHCMDATWAYDLGDWEGYAFSSRRASEIELEILKWQLSV